MTKNLDNDYLNQSNDHHPLFLFLHMPKCAGTTFRVHIENNFSPDEILPLYTNIDKRFRDRNFVKEYVTSLPEDRKKNLKLVYGHEVHYGLHEWLGRQGRYFTFLRHPLPRTISWYNYRRQKNWLDKEIIQKFIDKGITPDLNKWLENSPWVWNEMSGYFADFGYCQRKDHYSEQELKQLLDIFFFIGMTETFDEDALFMYSLLGVKTHFFKPQNISKKFFNPEETDAVKPLVLAKNKYDMKIFEEANLRHNKITSASKYRQTVLRMRLRRAVSPVLKRFNKIIGG